MRLSLWGFSQAAFMSLKPKDVLGKEKERIGDVVII